LLLEDSAFYAALILPSLRRTGAEVVHVLNGAEGLKRIEREHFDCVISDIEMPVMDGLEFARRARPRADAEGVALLAMSAMTDPTIAARALDAGFDEFHSKLEQDRLLSRLVELCSGAPLRTGSGHGG